MAESWLICENGYQTKCVDCPIRDENAEPCEHAIEVAPVRCGWWRPVYASEATGWDPQIAGSDPIWGYICTNCRNEAIFDCNDEHVLSDYCPNCGARMDGAE